MGEYLTLRKAAEQLGYTNHSTRRNAARLGRLRTVRIGIQLFTTPTWLDEWRQHVRPGNYRRGQARNGQDAGEASG